MRIFRSMNGQTVKQSDLRTYVVKNQLVLQILENARQRTESGRYWEISPTDETNV